MTTGPETVEYRVVIHDEDGSFWAEVEQLPGLFASGETREELMEALGEAIGMYLSTPGTKVEAKVDRIESAGEAVDAKVLVC